MTSNYSETHVLSFHTVTCSVCGVWFGVVEARYNVCRANGEVFYCTNGHSQVFRESDNARLRREVVAKQAALDRARADANYQREQVRATQRRLIATKGVVTRTKKRIAGGVCPCCKRTFQALAQHMKTQHPNYTEIE